MKADHGIISLVEPTLPGASRFNRGMLLVSVEAQLFMSNALRHFSRAVDNMAEWTESLFRFRDQLELSRVSSLNAIRAARTSEAAATGKVIYIAITARADLVDYIIEFRQREKEVFQEVRCRRDLLKRALEMIRSGVDLPTNVCMPGGSASVQLIDWMKLVLEEADPLDSYRLSGAKRHLARVEAVLNETDISTNLSALEHELRSLAIVMQPVGLEIGLRPPVALAVWPAVTFGLPGLADAG